MDADNSKSKKCNWGYFWSEKKDACTSCESCINEQFCVDGEGCTVCPEGYYKLKDGTCSQCNDKDSYISNDKCYTCTASRCEKCGISGCELCKEGYYVTDKGDCSGLQQ